MRHRMASRMMAYALPALWVLLGSLVFPALVGASPDLDGYVFYSDGSTGVLGADMKFENLTKGQVANTVNDVGGGRYYAYFPTSVEVGDVVEITAGKDAECGRVLLNIEERPQGFEVILGIGCDAIPTMNGLGGAALVLFLAALGALYIWKKRRTA